MICGAERPFRKEWKIKDMRRDTIGCAGIILMTQRPLVVYSRESRLACAAPCLLFPNNIYIYYIYIVGNDTISSVQVGSSVTRMMLFHSPYRPFNCDRIVTNRNIDRFFVSLYYRAISTVISSFFFFFSENVDNVAMTFRRNYYRSYRTV